MAQEPYDETDEIESDDALFQALGAAPRRAVVEALAVRTTPATTAQLAAEVAAATRPDAAGSPTEDDLRRWVVALAHIHLPKLQAAGLVDWNADADEVALTDWGERLSLRYADSHGVDVAFPNRQRVVD